MLIKVQKENWEIEKDRMSDQLNKTNEEVNFIYLFFSNK